MKVPVCRVHSVGDITAWGRQFLAALEGANVVEVTYEASLAEFCTSVRSASRPPILMVENSPDSKTWITKLRASGKRFYLVWFGRVFTKEDIAFALEQRVYCFFEHARAEDKKIVQAMKEIAESLDATEQYETLIHSMKALLLQAESDASVKSLVTEIKTAVSKLERSGSQLNEFLGAPDLTAAPGGKDTKVAFYTEQDFGDALNTVHNLERTGVLWVRGELAHEEGKVEFIQGKIVSALTGEVRGLKAIYRMFLWDEPRFMFTRRDPQDCLLEEHLNQSMKYVCLEGDELRRRYEKIRRELPPPDLGVELEPSALHVGAQIGLEDFSILTSVVEFNRIAQVLDYNLLPDVHIFESLIRLKKNNMIRVTA